MSIGGDHLPIMITLPVKRKELPLGSERNGSGEGAGVGCSGIAKTPSRFKPLSPTSYPKAIRLTE